LIIAWIEISTSEYFISNKRIYFKRGLISRVLNDINIGWVTNIFVQQSISGRILNFGNIGISTPGERAGAIGFVGVSDPMKGKAIIEDTLVKYKKIHRFINYFVWIYRESFLNIKIECDDRESR
jgi:uncharacterized membrane protein YdbT with pleckstrin-like domain